MAEQLLLMLSGFAFINYALATGKLNINVNADQEVILSKTIPLHKEVGNGMALKGNDEGK